MISESQERMLCVVEPAQLDAVLAVCERWETRATPIGEVTDNGRLRVFEGEQLVGDMPVAALVDECPLYDLDPQEPADRLGVLRGAARAARAGRRRRTRRCARCSAPRTSPAGAGCSSSTTRWSAAARCAARQQADAAVLRLALGDVDDRPRARRVDRRQRPARRLRPLRRRRRGGRRVRREPRLRGRGAARPHELPQLRQPREAARRVAADPRGRGHGRRLPRVRRAGRGRQRVALQRGARRARSTRRRSSGWWASCPTRARAGGAGASRQPGDMVALVGPFAPSLLGSELARLEGTLEGRLRAVRPEEGARGARARARRRARRARCAAPTTSPTAASRAASPSARSRGGVGRDSSTSSRSRAARESTAAPRCSARARAGSSSPGRATALLELSRKAAGVGFLALGQVGGDPPSTWRLPLLG